MSDSPSISPTRATQFVICDASKARPLRAARAILLWPLLAACNDDAAQGVVQRDGAVWAEAAADATTGRDAADVIGVAPDASADAAPRLSQLVETFFVPTCVLGRCHTTAVPAGELSFTGRRISVYAALVNAPSSEQPQRMRVVPFDPDASYLIEKLESDTPAGGTRMPPIGALPRELIEPVRAWIAAGARDD